MMSRQTLRAATTWMALAAAIGTLVPLAAIGQDAQEKDKVQAPIRFGDIELSNYARASVRLGVSATVTGENTTVDANDPKAKAKGQLVASELRAFMAPKTKTTVERIEAEGNVRFSGSRPTTDGKGVTNVRTSGTKVVYYKLKGFMEFTGPVRFAADQPSADGKSRESVEGVADRATYDQEKRIVVLKGNVSATVVTADTPPEGSKFSGDVVKVDMSEASYLIDIENESRQGKVNIRLKDQEPAPAPKKK